MPDKTYLGDGVYAELDEGGDIVLTTEDGYTATNRIVFDPSVLGAFEHWLARIREAALRRSTL